VNECKPLPLDDAAVFLTRLANVHRTVLHVERQRAVADALLAGNEGTLQHDGVEMADDPGQIFFTAAK
jgi:hypothetical protein